MSTFIPTGDITEDIKMLHDALPKPSSPPVALSLSKTKEQLLNYARAGYHYCVDQAYKGVNRTLWTLAGRAYYNAHEVVDWGNTGIGAVGALTYANTMATAAKGASTLLAKKDKSSPGSAAEFVPPVAEELKSPPPPGMQKSGTVLLLGGAALLYFLATRKKKDS